MATEWERRLHEHREAVARFAERLDGIDAERWRTPRGPGAWSPAEVAEHILLSFEVVIAELEGRGGVTVRTGPFMRTILRWVLLPHILFHRSVPLRARAPREVRPVGFGAGPAEAAARIRERAADFEAMIEKAASDPGAVVTHPYFGRLRPLQALRFSAVHLDHHRRQVEESLAAGPARP